MAWWNPRDLRDFDQAMTDSRHGMRLARLLAAACALLVLLPASYLAFSRSNSVAGWLFGAALGTAAAATVLWVAIKSMRRE